MMKTLISSLALGFVLTGTLFAGETTERNAAVPAAQIQKAAPKTSTPAGWTDDMEAAKKQAMKEGKLLLVDFSGSDWCGWCIRLDEEVFSRKEFTEGAKDKFVCVFIDSPRDKSRISELAKTQNEKLIDKYGIRGFPTVLILDANGSVIAETGYQSGGPKNYLKHLDSIIRAGQAFRDLEKEIGVLEVGSEERVKKIHAFTKTLSPEEQAKMRKLIDEVLAFDSDGSAGMRDEYPLFTIYMPLSEKVREISAKIYDDARDVYEKTTPEQRKDSGLGRKIFIEAARKHIDALRSSVEEIKAAKERVPKGQLRDWLRALEREVAMLYNVVEPQRAKEVPPQSEDETDPPKALFGK